MRICKCPRRALVCLAALLALPTGVAAGMQQEQQQQDQRPRFDSEARPAGEPIEIDGYADFRHGGIFIADGQRIQIYAGTEIAGEVLNPADIELGYEFKAWGRRLEDGVIIAERVEAKVNDSQMFETQVRAAGNELEREWVQAGRMYEPGANGDPDRTIGDIVSYDDRVKRVERIMAKLRPEYLVPGEVRMHVIDTHQWNASAMANGAIWVYTGLIDDMSDDELAIILGHELAHYTYEHSRRSAKKGMFTDALASLGTGLLMGMLPGGAARDVASYAALIGTTAFVNGYSRDLEDQADRVGLRYAHEAGYDVSAGIMLWDRFRQRYGENDQVTNFLLGSHSRPSDRIENVEREMAINYPDALQFGQIEITR